MDITLRDFFAGCAMVGLSSKYGDGVNAETCYMIADKMMAVRDRPPLTYSTAFSVVSYPWQEDTMGKCKGGKKPPKTM